MISTPSGTDLFEITMASEPRSALTLRRASRALSPKKRFTVMVIFPYQLLMPMTEVTLIVLVSGISLFDSTFRFGQARRRKRDSSQRRLPGTSSTGRQPEFLLLLRRFDGLAQQGIGQPRLDACAIRTTALQGLTEQTFEAGVERHDLQVVVAGEELLDDRAAQRHAHQRRQFAGILDARRIGRPALSMMVRMSRILTLSSSRFCSTRCTVDSGSSLGHQILDELRRILRQMDRATPAFPGARAIRRHA